MGHPATPPDPPPVWRESDGVQGELFGIQRFVDYSLEGALGIVPWVLPALIGTPAIWIWARHYRKKFGELGPARPDLETEPARRA